MRDPANYVTLIDDRPEDGIFRIHRSIYNDPAILEAEYRHIFEGGWLFLCHDSIIPKPGDYFTAHMGRQPVFVIRQEDGRIAAYPNACGHRGSQLLKPRAGNAKSITCPYHGFCFDPDGTCPPRRSARPAGPRISRCRNSICSRSPVSTLIAASSSAA